MVRKQVNIQELLRIVELPGPMLDRNDFRKATQQLSDWQAVCKKQRKILAKKYHPDVGGSLEKMQEINDAIDFLIGIKIQNRPQVRQRVVIIRANVSSATSSSTGTSWTSTRYW